MNSNSLIPPAQMKVVSDAIAKGKVLPSHEKSPQILAAMKPQGRFAVARGRQCGQRAQSRVRRDPAAPVGPVS